MDIEMKLGELNDCAMSVAFAMKKYNDEDCSKYNRMCERITEEITTYVNDLTEQVTHLRRVNSMLTASLFAQGEVHVRGD